MIYLISNIIKISHEKIIYLDNENCEKEIDLFECSKNWVEYYNSRDDFLTWEGEPAPKLTIEKNICIGERDWFNEKPYFEFYSNPKIRFEIQPQKRFTDHFKKYWHQRYYAEFYKLQENLRKAGWGTFDLG